MRNRLILSKFFIFPSSSSRGSDRVATVYCKVATIISNLAYVISIKKKALLPFLVDKQLKNKVTYVTIKT